MIRKGTIVFVLLILLLVARISYGEQELRLNGDFSDWRGQMILTDRQGDGINNEDFKSLSWGTTENQQKLYFMLERYPVLAEVADTLTCRIFMDINSNSSYRDNIDKFIQIHYTPNENKGTVKLRLYANNGEYLASYLGTWGEGRGEGGSRLEFAIPMEDLHVNPAQSINFYLTGIEKGSDRLPDKGDIMWKPFPGKVISKGGIAFTILLWAALTVLFYKHRIWVFYYVWGSVGFTFMLIILLRGSVVESQLEHQVAVILCHLLKLLDVNAQVFDQAFGALLFMVEADQSWTTISIDIESSGLLEMSILLGLILFYPAYSRSKKLLLSLVAITSACLINILRLVGIVGAIHFWGRDVTYIAHSVLGRLVFFILIVALYWEVLTKPSLKKVRENIEDDGSAF